MTSVPLLDVFTELRRRDFPIGIREYDDMLRALDNGLAASRAQLVFLCQTLWAKNKAECEEVAEVIERRLHNSRGEIAHAHEFDYILINDAFADALDDLQAIVRAVRQRSALQWRRHEALIAELLAGG